MNSAIVSRLTIIVLAVLAVWLGLRCLNDRNFTQSAEVVSERNLFRSDTLSNFNLLSRTDDQLYQEIAAELQDLNNTLEFMVWPEERLKLLRQSAVLTQKLINRHPTKSRYWQHLLNLQYEIAPDPIKLSWILEKIYQLEGWNNRAIINLSRYCVPFAFDRQERAPQACDAIIANLPGQQRKVSLAQQIGVSVDDLEIVLSRYLEGK